MGPMPMDQTQTQNQWTDWLGGNEQATVTRDRRFDPHTVRTFVAMNMSVLDWVLFSMYIQYVSTKKKFCCPVLIIQSALCGIFWDIYFI